MMCMGAAPQATITTPDTGAYDRLLDRQIAVMNAGHQQDMLLGQERLNQAVRAQQAALTAANAAAQQRAADTSANAARIAALIGTPPPEPTAKAPVLASDRQGRARAQGKQMLRIERGGAAPGAGAGLNIGGY
jgi:hypothetical protein